MNLTATLHAGVAIGTVLLFASLGELLTERAGILNLGVEGMMLLGAVVAYRAAEDVSVIHLALVMGMASGGVLSVFHAMACIHFRADQVITGLSISFLGTGIGLMTGSGLADVGSSSQIPTIAVPLLSAIPILGPIFFTDQSLLTYLGYLLIPTVWFYLKYTRPGLHLRAIGDNPATANALGINVYRLRYVYVVIGGMLCGLAGSVLSLSVSPGWFSEKTTAGLGWIAIGLVIFAQWDPIRAAVGSFLFGTLRRLVLDLQGPEIVLGLRNPFFYNPHLGFFLQMLPFAAIIVVLMIISPRAAPPRKRMAAPASLGMPYIREDPPM